MSTRLFEHLSLSVGQQQWADSGAEGLMKGAGVH